MATINRLVTQLAVDPAPMEAGFARGINITKAFAQSAAQALSTPPRNALGQFSKFGSDAASTFVTSLQKTYAQQQSQLLEAFARGSLSRNQFEVLGTQAAQGFNTALLNSISHLDAKGSLTPELRAGLVNTLKETGITGAQEFASGFAAIGGKLRSLGRDFTQFGLATSLAITAPLTIGAHEAIAAAETIQQAIDRIKVTTGAVGPQLDALGRSFTTLFASLPNSADDIAKALAGIAQATGATGPQLEALATQALNLSRITGTDLPTNVTATQRAFQAWGISLNDQTASLDTLFKVSQATGTTVSTLGESLGHFAPSLKAFGLTFAQSASLIGQFQKSGLDADGILTTLQTSLGKFAEKGVDGAHALQLLIDSLKNAGTDADAINLATRIFGPRQAAQISEAVRSGRLDIQKLTDAVAASGTTINGTAATTDLYVTATGKLHNATSLAAGAIGETLERAFLALAPTLISMVHGVQGVAEAFAALSPALTNTIIGILAFAAAFGPLVYGLGIALKAAGALGLGLGIIEKFAAGSAVAVGEVGAASAGAAVGIEAAAGAEGIFATGLAALTGPVGIAIIAITAIIAIYEHFTGAQRDATTALHGFQETAKTLSQTQLNIGIAELDKQIATVQARIADLNKPSTIALIGIKVDTKELEKANLELVTLGEKRGILGDTMEASRAATQKASDAMAEFNDKVAKVIESTGKGITVDPINLDKISGSLTHLQAEAKTLADQLASRKAIGGFDTTVAESALQHINTKILQLQNAGGPALGSIFDQLSPDLVLADKQVTALIEHATNLGGPLQQLSDVHLSTTLLDDLAKVNERLDTIKDKSSLDAVALTSMQKKLQGTIAAQIATNVTGSGAFQIDIDGHVKSIVVDPAAGRQLLGTVTEGLAAVRETAERAAAAQLNLETVTATGGLLDIELAGTAADVAFQKAKQTQDAFRKSVQDSRTATDEQKAALAALADEVTRAGATETNIKVAVGLKPEDIAFIATDAQKMIDRLPSPILPVKVFLDTLALNALTTEAAGALQTAQIQALAGQGAQAQGTRNATLDALAKQFKDLASTMDLKNPTTENIQSFNLIQKSAATLGVSLEELEKRNEALTLVGSVKQIAAAFADVTAAIAGAQSAIANLVDGFVNALSAAKNLADAIKSVQAANLAKTSNADAAISTVQNVAQLAGPVGQAIAAGIQVVKGVVGFISGLFGESALQKEHDAIQNSNTAALKNLTNSLDRQAGTAGRAAQIASAATAAQTRPFSVADEAAFPELRRDAAGFAAELAKYGLTIDQAEAAAKAFGITLFDSKHHLVGLSALADAEAAQAKILLTLGTDLSTQQKLIAVQNAVNNVAASPQQALNDQIKAITTTLGAQSAIAKQLTDAQAQGPEALRAALKALVAQIEAGTLTLADLGGFNSVTDLLDALGTTATDLNALGDAANKSMDALLNVPQGFKKALAEFNATTAQTSSTATLPTTFTGNIIPNIDPVAGGLAVSASIVNGTAPLTDAILKLAGVIDPTGTSSGGIVGSSPLLGTFADALAGKTTTGVSSGDVQLHGVTINIDARDKTAAQLFGLIKTEVQKVARQKTGDSTQIVVAFQQ